MGWVPCYRLRLHIQTAATAINPSTRRNITTTTLRVHPWGGMGQGGNGAFCAIPCLCACVPVPGRAGPPPASPSYPSASSRPKPQVPGSEVEMWLARDRVRCGQGDQEGYISAGVPSGRWVLGGVRALTAQLFIFQCPPPLPPATTACPVRRPACALLSALCQRWLPWLRPLSAGAWAQGRHLLIRIQYTPASTNTGTHPVTRTRRTRHVPPSSDHSAVGGWARTRPGTILCADSAISCHTPP